MLLQVFSEMIRTYLLEIPKVLKIFWLFLRINEGTIKIVTMSSFNVLSEIPILKMKTANKEMKNQIHYLKNSNESSDQENLSVVLLKASSSKFIPFNNFLNFFKEGSNLLCVIFSNGNLVIFDVQRNKLISSLAGHFLKVLKHFFESKFYF